MHFASPRHHPLIRLIRHSLLKSQIRAIRPLFKGEVTANLLQSLEGKVTSPAPIISEDSATSELRNRFRRRAAEFNTVSTTDCAALYCDFSNGLMPDLCQSPVDLSDVEAMDEESDGADEE